MDAVTSTWPPINFVATLHVLERWKVNDLGHFQANIMMMGSSLVSNIVVFAPCSPKASCSLLPAALLWTGLQASAQANCLTTDSHHRAMLTSLTRGYAGKNQNGSAKGGGSLNKIQRDFMDMVYDSGRGSRHRNFDRIKATLESMAADVRPVVVNLQEVSQELRPYNVHALGRWDGYTPLHVATHYGYEDVCKIFLSCRADPNIVESERGFAPLHAAVSRNLPTTEVLVQILLQVVHPLLRQL